MTDRRRIAWLFHVALLDKIGFSGIRAVLVLYLSRRWGWSDAAAYDGYATTMTLGFLTPLLGGLLADRFLGGVRALHYGAVLAAAGTLLLLVPTESCLYAGLALAAVGSGLLKSGVPTLLGDAAKEHGDGNDALYAALYLRMNIGTLLGTLGCAAVGEAFGWHYGLTVAAVASVACAVLALREPSARAERPGAAAAVLALAVPAIAFLIGRPALLPPLLGAAVALALAALLGIAVRLPAYRRAMALLTTLAVAHTIFFALYEQGCLSFVLFAARHVERGIAGYTIPVTLFEAIDPVLNVAFGGVFVALWAGMERARRNPGAAVKFAAGLALAAVSFLALAGGTGAMLSPWRLVGAYAIFVLAEQCVVPIGFAAVRSLAPPRYAGLLMGIWLLFIGASIWLGGAMSRFTAAAGGLTAEASIAVYRQVFLGFALGAAAAAALLALGARACSFAPAAVTMGGDAGKGRNPLSKILRSRASEG